ncbi:MAG TPA: glycine cleavage T C-terminal barrel domain-containing protein, partial [Caldimonas sp.]
IEDVSDVTALLALQGPQAARILQPLTDVDLSAIKYYHFTEGQVAGMPTIISRTGYTGEDGFELYFDNKYGPKMWNALMATGQVTPAGLGARDTLRLEAGLCLYGHDIDTTTTPVEAALTWAIQKVRRPGGERAGGYPGASVIERQLAGGVEKKRVGLLGLERAPVREGAAIVGDGGAVIGHVTSGTLGPSVGQPVALAYVPPSAAAVGTLLHADVRGKPQPMRVSTLPFAPHHYFRG